MLHYVATSGAAVTNVGLAGQWVDLDGGFLVGNVKEDEQAQDLNGDGVLDDFVPHVVDAASGSVLALPAAANQTIELSAGRVAYRLREGSVGWTLNADFDLDDSVLQVLDVASGITTNTGLGCSNGFLADGDYLACSVAESQQEQDLNGDGDELDEVPHAVHLPTLTLTNTGLAASMIFGGLRGRLLTLDVSEIQQGQDLNGDGDTTDSVLHVLNLVSGSGTSVGQATSLVVPGDRLVGFLVREGYQGTPDLNGDGDTSDDVWHAYDAALGTTVNLGVAAYHFDLAYGLAGEDFLVVSAREPASGGQDFNGDGDSNDQALFLLRVGEALQNLGVAVFLTGTTQYLAHSDRRVLFSVSESNQGVQDLNGDGDTTDAVVHVLDVP